MIRHSFPIFMHSAVCADLPSVLVSFSSHDAIPRHKTRVLTQFSPQRPWKPSQDNRTTIGKVRTTGSGGKDDGNRRHLTAVKMSHSKYSCMRELGYLDSTPDQGSRTRCQESRPKVSIFTKSLGATEWHPEPDFPKRRPKSNSDNSQAPLADPP